MTWLPGANARGNGGASSPAPAIVVAPQGSLAERAAALGLPFRDVSGERANEAAFARLSASDAARFGVFPLAFDGAILLVATSTPENLDLEQTLAVLTGAEIEFVASPAEAIAAALKRSDGAGKVLEDVSEEFRLALVRETEGGGAETIDLDQVSSGAAPVVRLVNSMIRAAIDRRASDIHVHMRGDGVLVDFRVDGVLARALGPFDAGYHASLISRIKVMAELDIAEHRVPQDGRFRLRMRHGEVDFRVSILPGVHGEDVVIRILDKAHLLETHRKLSLESLGFETDSRARLLRAMRAPSGLMLVTGPTGSGKTTTLYACLGELDHESEKIITIEDPVEYELPGVLQIPVNEKKNLTFARGLRSILRHDPDKIMVGEVRDKETAGIAVQAALTGHLVVTTLHANNAFDVIARLTHMGLDAHELVPALNCVLAQRLLRKLCAACKRERLFTAAELTDLGIAAAAETTLFFDAVGCESCGGMGYRGRMIAAEILELNAELRQMIVERRPAADLKAAARRAGLRTLHEAAMDKARAGATSPAEVVRVTGPAEEASP